MSLPCTGFSRKFLNSLWYHGHGLDCKRVWKWDCRQWTNIDETIGTYVISVFRVYCESNSLCNGCSSWYSDQATQKRVGAVFASLSGTTFDSRISFVEISSWRQKFDVSLLQGSRKCAHSLFASRCQSTFKTRPFVWIGFEIRQNTTVAVTMNLNKCTGWKHIRRDFYWVTYHHDENKSFFAAIVRFTYCEEQCR